MAKAELFRAVECAGDTVVLTIANGATTSGELDLRAWRGAQLYFGDMTETTLGFTSAPATGGTFTVSQDGDGNALSKVIATSGCNIPMPDELFAAGIVKLVVAEQEAGRTVTVVKKG